MTVAVVAAAVASVILPVVAEGPAAAGKCAPVAVSRIPAASVTLAAATVPSAVPPAVPVAF